MLRKLKPKSEFVRNVLTIMTGTSIAQAIPILISPILTRIYAPADFGVFAVFSALFTILAILSTGRYELAIILPHRDEDAAHVSVLAVGVSALLTIATLPLLLTFGRPLSLLLKTQDLERWLYLLPPMAFLTALLQVLNYWANRRKWFKTLATNRVFLSLVMVAVNLTMGWAGWGARGLILGNLIATGTAASLLLFKVFREDPRFFTSIRGHRIHEQALRYSDFPKFSILANVMNVLSNQLPVLLLNTFFNPTTSGLFFMTQRVLARPTAILSDSIQEVFKQRASRDYAELGNCADIFAKTAKKLILISLPPALILLLAGPSLFAYVFGEAWRPSGEYARILSVMLFFSFTASPLSYVFYIVQKQKYDLIWQLGLLVVTSGGIYAGHLMGSASRSILFFSLAYSCMYMIYGIMSYRLSHPAKGASQETSGS